jgi:hypothetical protein
MLDSEREKGDFPIVRAREEKQWMGMIFGGRSVDETCGATSLNPVAVVDQLRHRATHHQFAPARWGCLHRRTWGFHFSSFGGGIAADARFVFPGREASDREGSVQMDIDEGVKGV